MEVNSGNIRTMSGASPTLGKRFAISFTAVEILLEQGIYLGRRNEQINQKLHSFSSHSLLAQGWLSWLGRSTLVHKVEGSSYRPDLLQKV